MLVQRRLGFRPRSRFFSVAKVRQGSLLSLMAVVFVAVLFSLGFSADPLLASGGRVLLKTDNGPDGYYYNALGVNAGRYVTRYEVCDFRDPSPILCGVRIRELDQSTITPGVDDYTLLVDLRRPDPNCPGYADLASGGLIARADPSSLGSCSTTGASRTATFGGGNGIPIPDIQAFGTFYVTAAQLCLPFLRESDSRTVLDSGSPRTRTRFRPPGLLSLSRASALEPCAMRFAGAWAEWQDLLALLGA